jgi:hypothetical protein
MRPAGTRTWRKGLRRASRGIPAGRRATHEVETAYGQRQKARDRAAEFSAWCAQRRETTATAGEGN